MQIKIASTISIVVALLTPLGHKTLEPTAAALYLEEHRRPMTSDDYRRYPGAGVLFCRDEAKLFKKAATAWLIGARSLVMMNAHNFRNREGNETRSVNDCYLQISGRNYDFDGDLELGIPSDGKALHITDDWALAHLAHPVEVTVNPQPAPTISTLPTGDLIVTVTMVSPAGHGNYNGSTSIEPCRIHQVDPPTEGGIRRARHDCNDGYGGSGSGLFDKGGHLVAMQSASLDMNRRLAFDRELHYGSALLIEGELRDAIMRNLEKTP
ncbi:serine protease [Bradyrhizobium ontarionense]|uniref:Serine protease n=1 Tax=Bradyrhizobium ontarionense TaxID=2898149 RepID=A0ABY3R5T6_9BRAD|nr:trypsin-like peptidase domain-containing protein [Bradyrhizobium sp. A19]UFZ02676.1 serine protease [Bradyrhizobium sp. A19]